MAIKIYTYADPYSIDREPYWREIENCPHFCVSQTMVNGLEDVYSSLKAKQTLTTMRILLNSLYSDWEDKNTRVRQIMEIDNAIYNLTISGENADTIRRSLEYNTTALVSAVRLFVELGVDAEKLVTDDLNYDQELLVQIYRDIASRDRSAFSFNRAKTKEEIVQSIADALIKKHKDLDVHSYSENTIVIHGIHQFSGSMLCAIEDISKYLDVILLFNYQNQYKAIYQTWLNIYSLFDLEIGKSNVTEFHPISLMRNSFASNKLADCMGALTNGEFRSPGEAFNNLEVIEFANLTEFAGYCTVLFEKAVEQKRKSSNKKAPTLTYMPEQMYSASGKVNDILRSYFPEQFGERHFLDYPIGHFFVSAVNMWDNEATSVRVQEMSDIKECLSAGILKESRRGCLINTFNLIEPYIAKETSLNGIIVKLKNDLRKLIINSKTNNKLKRISYINVDKADLKELTDALEELSEIITYFFSDFNKGTDNFQRFYNRIHDFITNRIKSQDDLDNEMKEIVKNLLDRLSNTNLPETGSFTCLKQTLSYYLSQDDSMGKSANWIVRDFEQIDGDILRSRRQSADRLDMCYHFCCLSDKELSAVRDERLPWPLDIHFFEIAYEPLDLKYQIFLKSKMEFKNFKRYALLYGLEFNRLSCKLSYIKTEDRKENELYHLISMLGVKVTKYQSQVESRYLPKTEFQTDDDKSVSFGKNDSIRYRMCHYKFALESCVQERTIFRERFLIVWYMRILLQSAVAERVQSERISTVDKLKQVIEEEYSRLDDQVKIANELEKTQVISGVYSNLSQKIRNPKSVYETPENRMIREEFLAAQTKSYQSGEPLDLEEVIRKTAHYFYSFSDGCKYCASKDVCLHARFE